MNEEDKVKIDMLHGFKYYPSHYVNLEDDYIKEEKISKTKCYIGKIIIGALIFLTAYAVITDPKDFFTGFAIGAISSSVALSTARK